jgi:hypothetical protein
MELVDVGGEEGALNTKMKQTITLLAGVPAAGKSHFGEWIELYHAFLHLDVEKDGRLDSMGLGGAWATCFTTGDVRPFVLALRATGRSVIVNWGFPVPCLPIVAKLKRHGVVLWWFDADPQQAKAEFTKRGDVPLAAFERQMAAIADSRKDIEALFSPNIVTALAADGSRMTSDELFERMFSRAP